MAPPCSWLLAGAARAAWRFGAFVDPSPSSHPPPLCIDRIRRNRARCIHHGKRVGLQLPSLRPRSPQKGPQVGAVPLHPALPDLLALRAFSEYPASTLPHLPSPPPAQLSSPSPGNQLSLRWPHEALPHGPPRPGHPRSPHPLPLRHPPPRVLCRRMSSRRNTGLSKSPRSPESRGHATSTRDAAAHDR